MIESYYTNDCVNHKMLEYDWLLTARYYIQLNWLF